MIIREETLTQIVVKKSEYIGEKIQKYAVVFDSDEDNFSAQVTNTLLKEAELYGPLFVGETAKPLFLQVIVSRKSAKKDVETEKK